MCISITYKYFQLIIPFCHRFGLKSKEYRERNKGFDVLSFDGGGTKGVMEAVIMKDIMNMATILIRNPKSIVEDCLELFNKNASNDDITTHKPNLVSLKKKLDDVKDPVHPVDVFDMIVGTSTGKRLLI